MLFSLFYRSMIIEEEAEKEEKVEVEVSKVSENAKEEKVEVEVSKESEMVRVTVCVADYKQFVNKPLTLDLTTVFP